MPGGVNIKEEGVLQLLYASIKIFGFLCRVSCCARARPLHLESAVARAL